MNREEAVNRFKGIRESFSISIAQSKFYPSKAELNELCDMAIEALTYQNLSKPNNTCEVDLISRHEALMELNGACEIWEDDAIVADIIHKLPSIEIVRCKDCRHRVHDEERGLYYCEMYYGQGDVSDENFCQWGERSEE